MISRTSPATLEAPTGPLPLETMVIFLQLVNGAEISAAIYNTMTNIKLHAKLMLRTSSGS